ncbi:MAG: CHAT domain-containing protein, partial [Chitinophagaceae bacterium]
NKFSISVISGINASEESIKALNGKASPAVLHIATHGFFFPDPKDKDGIHRKFETSGKVFKQSDNPLFRSGLLLAGANNAWQNKAIEGVEDGILTSYEVSNLYLPNTKLVVLSACETGLGDIQGSEGVYGLQRAFKMAGVQNLIMSLWKVPDAETAEFMQKVYKNLFAGKNIGDAFYHAQTIMKNKYRGNPNKWAAWVLVR